MLNSNLGVAENIANIEATDGNYVTFDDVSNKYRLLHIIFSVYVMGEPTKHEYRARVTIPVNILDAIDGTETLVIHDGDNILGGTKFSIRNFSIYVHHAKADAGCTIKGISIFGVK